jgi:hypothetical protein
MLLVANMGQHIRRSSPALIAARYQLFKIQYPLKDKFIARCCFPVRRCPISAHHSSK